MTTVVDAIVDDPGGGSLTVVDASGAVDSLAWTDVHDRARRIATILRTDGLGRGCRVGLLADSGVDLVAALQAVWLIGGAVTVLPLPVRRRQRGYVEQIRAAAADAGLHAVVTSEPFPIGEPVSALGTTAVSLAELVGRAAAAEPGDVARPDPGDLAILQYTSGSTRVPRGVPVTHGHLAANLAGIRHATEHERDHPGPLLSWLPLYHDLGLVGALILPMSCGCSLVLVSPIAFVRRPAVWLEAIARYRPTCSGGPNFAYGLLTRILRGSSEVDLSSLRHLICGGEPVDPATMTAFLAAAQPRGLDPSVVTPAYGLAESTLAVTYPPRGRGLRVDAIDPVALETRGQAVPVNGDGRSRALVRLGWPVPGTALRVVDRHTGAEVNERRVGRIEIRGPSVVGHYWGEPPGRPDSWLRTGDLGYLADGDLVVCGREKDVLFVAGRNIFPTDVEAVVAEVPDVRLGGVAAFGIPTPTGDRLVIAVECRGARSDAVRRAVAAAVLDEVGVAPAAVPVLPPRRLPRTSSGKLRRAEARRQYLCGELELSRPDEREQT